jgi:Zn-dependent protease with chaperone function
MRRLAALLLCLALLAPAAPALAQNSPFGPLPQPAEPTPAPTPDNNTSVFGQDVGRSTLYIIAGALLVTFVFIGWWISRDARRSLREGPRSLEAERRRHDPHERHRRQREKERARKKTRAQKQARKAHRKR